MVRQKVSITVDPALYRKFKTYCDDNALMISRKIELLLKQEMGDYQSKSYPSLARVFEQVIAQNTQKAVHKEPEFRVPQPRPAVHQRLVKAQSKKPIPTIDQLRIRRGL